MAPVRRTTSAPRPGAVQRAASAGARQAEKEAARKAAEEEAARLAEQDSLRADRASADNVPEQLPADPNNPNAADDDLFAVLTDAGTMLEALIDPRAVTSIFPGVGSVLSSDPVKAARGEHEMGPITEVHTIGGSMHKVLEDVATVASILGV